MSQKQRDFMERVDRAILDYINGSSRKEATEKHQVSAATLNRHMRKRGLRLSPEELRVRRHQAGKTTQERHRERVIGNKPCPYGCTCGKHKPNKHNLKNPIIMGRKNCSKCGRWRPILDFFVRDRDKDGNPLGFQTTCKVCMAAVTRYNQGIRRRGRPYEKRKPAMTEQERREHRRRLHRWKMENDPAYAADRREYARIYAEGKRREAGIPRREAMIAKRSVGGVRTAPKLPLAPFQAWIRERASFYASDSMIESHKDEVAGIGKLASECGISERSLRRFLNGYEIGKNKQRREITNISLATVDQCLTNEGSTLIWELYPDNLESSYLFHTDDHDVELDLETCDDILLAA